MRIGEERRTIIVEPLELPVSDPRDDSCPHPATPKPELSPEPGAGTSHLMSTPDYISAIVGYRVWQWAADGLQSLNGEPWFPNSPLIARCRALTVRIIVGRDDPAHSANPAPREDCSCGVYAAKSLEHLRRTQYWRYGIHGEVNLWGTVVEHEHGWRAQLAYPKALFLPLDILPYTFAAIQSRLRRLIAYGADIFVADPNGNVKLWSADSGFDSAGLECLIEKTKEFHHRRRQGRTFKKGERVALLGLGIAVVWQIDDQSVQVMLGNKHSLRIARSDIAWNHQNMRWETGRRYLNQGQKMFQCSHHGFSPSKVSMMRIK